jgi:hypothetical protein
MMKEKITPVNTLTVFEVYNKKRQLQNELSCR